MVVMRRGELIGVGVAALFAALAACTGSVEPDGGGGAGASNTGGSGASGAGGATGSGAAGGLPDPASGAVVLESVSRRLTQAEIDNVVRDVLSDDSAPATRILLEDEYSPYDNDYTLQQASRALIDGLEAMAEDVARRALADAEVRAAIVPCTPTDDGDADCFRQVIETLGRRLFRRPLAETEVEAYLTLQSFAIEDNPHVDNDFYTAVELFLRSVLQDPEFLYRLEVGTASAQDDVFELTPHEIATRLAFLLWGSTPDDRLLDVADAGGLRTPEERRTVALDLLADDRAKKQLHRFHAMWLGYRAIPHAADLVAAFQRETTALIDRVVFEEPQSYLSLFTLDETFVDAELADHYGFERPSGDSGWVPYPAGRAGVLSHGSAYLLQKMKATEEGDGSLLDNAVVIFMPEAGHGTQLNDATSQFQTHSVEDMVLLVAGRAGGLLPGRHLATAGAHPAQCLVSCMQAAGYTGDRLGEVSGNLPELFG